MVSNYDNYDRKSNKFLFLAIKNANAKVAMDDLNDQAYIYVRSISVQREEDRRSYLAYAVLIPLLVVIFLAAIDEADKSPCLVDNCVRLDFARRSRAFAASGTRSLRRLRLDFLGL